MVTNVTSLTGNGLKDWLIQRVTAVYFAIYAIFLVCFFVLHPHLHYFQWVAFMHARWVQIASLLALLSLSLHAWIGIWTVTTDYIKCTCLRLTVQLLVMTLLLSQFIWGFMIMWGQ